MPGMAWIVLGTPELLDAIDSGTMIRELCAAPLGKATERLFRVASARVASSGALAGRSGALVGVATEGLP